MKSKCFGLLLLFLFSLVSIGAYAQVKVEGSVFDETDNPLIGVSVFTEGRKTGTVTNADGHFTIMVPDANSYLTFSYVGYMTQKVQLKGKKILKIVMKEDTELLDEVVVVGYGTQKKINVTGAIAQVDNKELKMAPSGNLSSMLAGRLPGLITKQSSGQPGKDGASLYIRGNGAGDGDPLIVIDGVVTDYFPTFSPDEVESITILKDATAAAVYGVRAAAGVILITTKRGTIQKPTVTVNSSVTLSQNTNFPKFLNGPDYAYWYNTAQRLDGVAEESLRFTANEIDRIENPGDNEAIYGNTDWFDLLFKNVAPAYTNNVSVSGGTERLKFFASVGAYNQEGVIDHTSYDKYNFRSNMDAKVTDNFDLSLDLSGYVSEDNEPGASAGKGSYASIFQQAMLSYPYLKAYSPSGLPVGSLNLDGNGNNNPVAARDLSGKNTIKKTYFQGNISMKYKLPFVKGLSLKLNASYVKNYTMQKKYFLPYDLDCWNQSTRDWVVQKGRIASKASLNQWFTESQGYTIQPTIEYSNKFGKHAVSGLFLYEYSRTDESSLSAGREDFPITDIMDMSYGLTVNENLVKGGHGLDRRAGYVFRFNYSYDDKYLLEVTSRIDASTALPKKYRWGVFPGVSVGWRISQEDFFKEAVPFMENLKVRASAGRLGSDRSISNTMTYFSTATLSKDPIVIFGSDPQKYLGLSRPINPSLKWELTDTYNVGIESSMWNGLLGVELDVFYMKTTRSLEKQSGNFPLSLGDYFPAYINYGSHDNRGFELVLTHHNRVKDFNYSVRGNVSWARNKILKMTEDANVPNYMRSTGRPMGEYWGFVAEGLFQTEEEIAHSAVYGPTLPGDIKLKDINGDGKITYDQDRVPIGRSSTPEMMFGLNLAGEWKGIDFSMLLQGAALFDVNLCGVYADVGYDNTFYTKPFYCDGNTPYYLVENSWRPDHTNADYPRLGIVSRENGGKMSSWWVEDGAYVRLKTLQVGYTLPSKWTAAAGIKKVRAYFAGGNLLTLSHLKHLDPEMPGVNQGYYPQQRTFEFGLNISF
ncbi:TonB-dependent receptor [Bacteroides sp.]|uniref:SusC/RagA family TonB-linked outer membrane protein n=1 Tax=Bacteroides sp. TaxID=29523 RepID=UPI0025C2FD23|nr:TonB-dependent receptor [Bacteroides sp.]